MRIAFDAKRLYCNFTGLGNHSRTSLDILTQYFPQNDYLLFTPKVKEKPETLPYLHSKAMQTILPQGFMKGGLWRTFCLAKEAKKYGADLFHGLSNELPVGIEKTRIPAIVTIHDVAFKTFTDMYHWQDRQIYDLKWRYACRHAQRIIAISECTKQDILRFYDVPEDRIEVVYQPVAPFYYERAEHLLGTMVEKSRTDSQEESARLSESVGASLENCPGSAPELLPQSQLVSGAETKSFRAGNKKFQGEEQSWDCPFMLYVGSINSRKNVLSAVKALELLPESLRIPLYIVGSGREYKREVENYILAHHLEHLCRFLSNVSNEQLHELYRHARLFVYPSFYEGFGLPLVEARLSGCPVISSNISSLPEAAGQHALLVDPQDDVALSQAMEKLIADDQLHDDLALKSLREAFETLHPKHLAEQLMTVYQTVSQGV